MELPWSGVDCNTVMEPRGGCCTPATWGCATSETLRSESGWPAPRETGLCFTFALVSALCRETGDRDALEREMRPAGHCVGGSLGLLSLLLCLGKIQTMRSVDLTTSSSSVSCSDSPLGFPFKSAEEGRGWQML